MIIPFIPVKSEILLDKNWIFCMGHLLAGKLNGLRMHRQIQQTDFTSFQCGLLLSMAS